MDFVGPLIRQNEDTASLSRVPAQSAHTESSDLISDKANWKFILHRNWLKKDQRDQGMFQMRHDSGI